MAKTANKKIVLCFKDGEPYLYDKEKKKYIAFCFVKDKTIAKVKQILNEMELKKRPQMRKIWQILASTIPNCDGFCNSYSVKTACLSENCFESFFSREITFFLNEWFPLEEIKKQNELKRIYEKELTEQWGCSFSPSLKRLAIKNKMDQKAGRKIYR